MVYASTVLKKYNSSPEEIQKYFSPCENFTDDENMPWDVVISYMFSKIEIAQNNTLYIGIRRKHKGEKTMVRRAIDEHPIYRKDFKIFFQRVFDTPFPKALEQKLKHAEATRDKIMHGKNIGDPAKKKAVMDILEYASDYNMQLAKIGGFKPFGSLQGAIGRTSVLGKEYNKMDVNRHGFFQTP